jgi:hypothetical protein
MAVKSCPRSNHCLHECPICKVTYCCQCQTEMPVNVVPIENAKKKRSSDSGPLPSRMGLVFWMLCGFGL